MRNAYGLINKKNVPQFVAQSPKKLSHYLFQIIAMDHISSLLKSTKRKYKVTNLRRSVLRICKRKGKFVAIGLGDRKKL